MACKVDTNTTTVNLRWSKINFYMLIKEQKFELKSAKNKFYSGPL